MKKYIAPEMNVTKFDVEDVITTSVAGGTTPVYGNSDYTAEDIDFTKIFA